MKMNRDAFWRIGHHGLFYAYLKLMEQEMRNIVWIAECIAQQHRQNINDYILVDGESEKEGP